MKVGIAGAGLIGRLLANQLLEKPHCDITLFDKDSISGSTACGSTAAGMIAPLAELETADSILFELGLQSIERWPSILQQLPQPVDYQQHGSLLTAHAQDIDNLTHFVKLLNKKSSTSKYITRLDKHAVLALEPELAHHQHLYHLTLEGQINPQQLFVALQKKLQAAKITWRTNTLVTHITPGAITTNKQTEHFDIVFDCRGLGAKADLPSLRGIRGELVMLHAPDVALRHPVRLLHPRYRLYVVPYSNATYAVGASEIESNDMSPISVRTVLELLSAAYSLHSGFAEARVIETKVNCRPAFDNNLPALFHKPGLIAINGLYRHGYLLAPVLVEEAIKLMDEQTMNYPELLGVAA